MTSNSPRIKVCLIDDDLSFIEVMERLLLEQNFNCSSFTTLQDAKEKLPDEQPDVIILDLYFPDGTSFSFLNELREKTPFGLILLSGSRLLDNRIEALKQGADFYLTKPVDIREISACIESIVKRLQPARVENLWILDQTSRTLLSPSSQTFDLTNIEYLLINQFISKEDLTVKREEALAALGKSELSNQDRTIDLLISRLRKKIPSLPILSVRNVGYLFSAKIKKQ